MLRFILLLSCLSAGVAHAVTFELTGSRYDAQLTLTGPDIIPGQEAYNSSELSDYEIDFRFDFGDGWIDFEVTDGSFGLRNFGSDPDIYRIWHRISLNLYETSTIPGVETEWGFTHYMDTFPGNANDDVLYLLNRDTRDRYDDSYPADASHVWVVPVPAPGALWLLLSALPLFGMSIRRDKKS